MALTISWALAGAVLGMRYKVLALVPAIGLAVLVVLILGIGRGDGGWTILGAAVAAATALQVGYLAGTLTRFAVAGARGARLRRAWMRATASAGPLP
jgi:hypothetical protein